MGKTYRHMTELRDLSTRIHRAECDAHAALGRIAKFQARRQVRALRKLARVRVTGGR